MTTFFYCSMCSTPVLNILKLYRHYSNYHLHDFNLKINCCYSTCNKSFKKLHSFQQHVRRTHGTDNDPKPTLSTSVIIEDLSARLSENLIQDTDFPSLFLQIMSQLKKSLGHMFLKLREKHVVASQVHVDLAIDIREVFTVFFLSYNSLIKQFIQQNDVVNLVHILDNDYLYDVFSYFIHEYQLINFCKTDLKMVEPQEKKITVSDGITYKYHYISVKDNLERVLGIEDIFNEFFHVTENPIGIMYDYCDGEIYKRHSFFTKHPTAIRVHLFIDEFETVNPLGSKKGKQKLCGVYYTIGNLHPCYCSITFQIHLFILFSSKILQFSSYHDVLKPLVDELISLMNSYVTVIQGETKHSLHVCIAQYLQTI
nr:uncharacterized protein LOC124817756 [Hydra vulgaris]XP_047144140.1 uncharacterized protein LOC124817756 [Hydra vulgaris]